jgi:hypothetical protein
LGTVKRFLTTSFLKRQYFQTLRYVLIAVLTSAVPARAGGPDVLTQRYDISRSGTQLYETVLTPANVTPATFGRLYARTVNAQIISQPLYASQVLIPSLGLRNVVYVVTRANTVYAFDADGTDTNPTHGLVWSMPVTVEAAASVPGMCSETVGPVGVTSTPVIDRTTNTMYLVARRADGTIWLIALDITTGAMKNAVQIAAAYNGLNFNQGLELQRAGLLLQNGAVILGFSALNCDNAGWHGWVLAYRATDLTQVGVFATTSSAGWGGGVWQSGTGLVGDGFGNIFFMTGNGSVNGTTDFGESFVKLTLGTAPAYGLTYQGSYTVANFGTLNSGDTDLGSGGPLLLPGNRLVGGGKQGKLYVLNSLTMQPTQNLPAPGPQPPGGSDGFQAFINTWHVNSNEPSCMINGVIVQVACNLPPPQYELDERAGPNIHAGLIYWNGTVYGMPEKDYLRAYAYNSSTGVLNTTPTAVSTVRSPDGMPGGALSLSANGSSNGILWAQVPKFDGQWVNVPGTLIAFDALSLNELWSDDDDIAYPAFNPVTVADGKVFRPTFANALIVYGPRAGLTAPICYTIPQLYQNYAGAQGILGPADGPATTTPDGIGSIQTYTSNTGAIMWSPATCAHEMHGAIYTEYNYANHEYNTAQFLGYPLTNETANSDGIGTHNDFTNGSIYWSPITQAHETHGAIRAYWLGQGGISSVFGYPVSDETDQFNQSGRFSLFEHGVIYWARSTNTITVLVNAGNFVGPQQTNTDRPGQDFTVFTLPEANPVICQERCTANSQCVAWTYVAPNTIQGPQPNCWLKSGLPLSVPNQACTSGVNFPIQSNDMSAMQGAYDETGGDFTHFSLVSPDPRLCQGECAYNASCKAWTYVLGGVCWLKSTQPPLTQSFSCTSGTKIN